MLKILKISMMEMKYQSDVDLHLVRGEVTMFTFESLA